MEISPDAHSAPRILFEDPRLMALYKPAGLDVFASRGGRTRSLWSWLLEGHPELQGVGDGKQPAIAHRLDRYTSGLVVAGRNQETYRALRQAFGEHRVSKEYLALVEGEIPAPLESDLPIGSRYRRSKLSSVALPGRKLRSVRPAHTRVWPLAGARGFTLCRVQIHTGVRHQIRVHLSHLGYPVAGDRDYRASLTLPGLGKRFFLHAWKLSLPALGEQPERELTCPPAGDLTGVLQDLGFGPVSALDA